ncbi:MAG TPA: NADP-dependent oxidoreductase [Bryobacteraceae bacterium]|nr:NADP-dependent oxidoreductase [Bryobacteraceae bacterium]
MMKSLHVIHANGSPALVERDVPRPKLARGELLVRVHAAGITPTELIWYPTSHNKDGSERIGAVPSHEFSGEIAELGAEVEGLSVGQQIYGLNDWFVDGALAEYCIARPEWIAPKPHRANDGEAASIPIGALTAWQGLFERANVTTADRVLVHGGAGAVGVFAIQLARLRGAHVIATASSDNLGFVRELGAAEAIDYKAERFEDKARDIDVVFDGVGGETFERSWKVLKPSGRLVTIAADETTTDERAKRAFFIVEPKRDQLLEISKLIDSGDLRTVVDRVLPWSMAADAYTGKVERSRRGKLVVQVKG